MKVEFFKPEDFHSKGPFQLLVDYSTKAIECDEAAQIANRILAERGTRVIGIKLGDSGLTDQHRAGWTFAEENMNGFTNPTHTAFLVCIQPIAKPDTAESLLREATETWVVDVNSEVAKWLDRARALLGLDLAGGKRD